MVNKLKKYWQNRYYRIAEIREMPSDEKFVIIGSIIFIELIGIGMFILFLPNSLIISLIVLWIFTHLAWEKKESVHEK